MVEREPSLQTNLPVDRYNIIYLFVILHGIGTLMPWNMFIQSYSYFTELKLSANYTGENLPYVSNFMQYLTFASQVPNICVNWLNIFIRFGNSNLVYRIVWSIMIEILLFLWTLILAMVDSSHWPTVFFYLTLTTVVMLHLANGIYQNTIFGLAAKLPPKYTGGLVLGNNVCGTFTAIVQICVAVSSRDLRMEAIYFFITALFVLLVCIDSYFAMPLNKFYRYYERREFRAMFQRTVYDREGSTRPPYLHILYKSKMQLYNIFFIFFVSLSIFPAIQANIHSLRGDDFWIPTHLFGHVTCFLTFNLFAMTGSFLALFCTWPGPEQVWIYVTLRALYIPFFLFCNYQVPGLKRKLIVLFRNEYLYWFGAATLSFTSGYLSALAMMFTPRTVEEKYRATAGMFAGATLILGVFVGICSTFLWPLVIQ